MNKVMAASVLSLLISQLALASPARAQVAWDAPTLIAPGAPAGLSVLLWDPHPGDELGVLAAWRSTPAPVGIGFRGGLAEAPRGELSAVFGLDVSGSLGTLDEVGNAGVLWWTGAGLGFGDELLVSLPLGIVLGWRASEEGVSFAPYVGGHVALDLFTGPGDDVDLDGAVDLGMDLTFGSGFTVRFGASVGGRDALGVGVRFPL